MLNACCMAICMEKHTNKNYWADKVIQKINTLKSQSPINHAKVIAAYDTLLSIKGLSQDQLSDYTLEKNTYLLKDESQVNIGLIKQVQNLLDTKQQLLDQKIENKNIEKAINNPNEASEDFLIKAQAQLKKKLEETEAKLEARRNNKK